MRWRRLLVVAAAVALAACSAATAATSPTPHDRALAQQLAAKVAAFQALGKQDQFGAELERTLKTCPGLKQDALGGVIALVPALLVDVVGRLGPQLRDLRTTLAAMRPDSTLFASWLRATGQSLALLLAFDNHGRKVDYCRAAQVLMQKNPSRQQIQAVLGIDPASIARLFSAGTAQATATQKALSARMRAFFVAAGLPAKTAAALTA